MKFDIISTLSLDLPAFIVAITVHEFMHALVAYKLGDNTPKEEERLTLNPVEHLDFVGTLFPIILSSMGSSIILGWGKPVNVNYYNLRNPNKDYGLVAIAGPIGNITLCLVVGLFLNLAFNYYNIYKYLTIPAINYLFRLLAKIFTINLALFLFNLLPIPPLDGSKLIHAYGNNKIKSLIESLENYNLIIFSILFLTNLHSLLLAPIFIKITQFLIGNMWIYILQPIRFIIDFM